jgi:hypothetical protein
MGAGYAAVCRAARAPSREVKMLFHGVRRGGDCQGIMLSFFPHFFSDGRKRTERSPSKIFGMCTKENN